MRKYKRLVAASAMTVTATLGIVVALARPAHALPAAAPADVVPTFVNGLAQPVFSSSSANWVRGEVWVQTDFDSDGDGKPDRMHADYAIPGEAVAEGLKVPIIYEDSPYFAGLASSRQYSNWNVDHELGAKPPDRPFASFFAGTNTSPIISNEWDNPWISRGFAVVHSESPGTGYSDGCPSSGGTNETLGATAIVDWLNGRRKAYTTRTGDTEATATSWSSGHVAMMGVSYNGTLPIAAATTGVQGLDAIVPISAISDWYDYYRANGMVREPDSNTGGNGTNAYDGEDLDVLEDAVYSRRDETGTRLICRPEIVDTATKEDRLTGDRNAFWDERDYMKDVQNVHAAVLLDHGNNDYNVMTKNAAQFYDALKRQGVPHMFFFHQGGHGAANPPDVLTNLWFSHFLYGVDNGVQNLPRSWVVREANACPPRQTTVTGDQSNTATLTVADTRPFQLGFTLTVPRTNADGTVTNVTQAITNIPDATHLVLANAVATAAGQKVADGAVVSLVCGNANPTPYSEWPDPASAPVTLHLLPGGVTRGNLTMGAGSGAPETLTDDASVTGIAALNAATSPQRLIYQSPVLTQDVRLSGTPTVSLSAAFSKPRANLSVYLVSFPAAGGAGTILTRGWRDPENRNSDYVSDPVAPGTFYRLNVDLMPKDSIVKAGNRLGLMVMSSDHDYTIRPAPGTQVTVDPAATTMTLPVVGGAATFAQDTGTGFAQGSVGGTVPATLALTLGQAASFGPFTPGVAHDYTATTTATVTSSAGDAALTVSDPDTTAPGHLVNGAYVMPQALKAGGAALPATVRTYTAPVSNDQVPVTFQQSIAANDPLRTGTYAKTLTFTLSTTNP
jgi:predicted acyl esterase